jgi:sterol desaturase/sphingolipid hydroxylase (fatty acid hydroxylase superfamily)
VTALFTIALFVADDFTRFLLHWMMHKVPALWALHRVHHSAEVLTPITIYRVHPLESFFYSLRLILAQGIVLGIFFYGFGMRLSAWEVAGANAITYCLNLAGANLRHSHVWLSFGPWLEYLFISPAQHQIHHSEQPEHFDRNFGAFLAIWDLLFRSLYRAAGQRRPSGFGLGRGQGNPHTRLHLAYLEPLAALGRSIWPGQRRIRAPGSAVPPASPERPDHV